MLDFEEDVQDAYLFGPERYKGVSWKDFKAKHQKENYMPKHPYDGLNENGEREYDAHADLYGTPSASTAISSVEAAVNPVHYKDVIPGYQYMQTQLYLLKGFEGVEAHLLGQIYKYAMRLGKKDSKLQDASKIAWYAECLKRYYETGEIAVDL